MLTLPDDTYRMYFCSPAGIGSATSSDGLTWSTESGSRLAPSSDEGSLCDPTVVRLADGRYRLYYKVQPTGGGPMVQRIYSAISSDGLTFTREGLRIADTATCNDFASVPEATLLPDGRTRIYFVCNAQLNATYSAISTDGLTFTIEGQSVARAVDPAVLRQPDGSYVMVYTTTPSGSVVPPTRLYLATSHDGLSWAVHGEVLAAGGVLDPQTVVDPTIVGLSDGRLRVYYWDASVATSQVISAVSTGSLDMTTMYFPLSSRSGSP